MEVKLPEAGLPRHREEAKPTWRSRTPALLVWLWIALLPLVARNDEAGGLPFCGAAMRPGKSKQVQLALFGWFRGGFRLHLRLVLVDRDNQTLIVISR